MEENIFFMIVVVRMKRLHQKKSSCLGIEIVRIHTRRYAALVDLRIDAFITGDHKKVVHRDIGTDLLDIFADLFDAVAQCSIVQPHIAPAFEEARGITVRVDVVHGFVGHFHRDVGQTRRYWA